VYWTMGAPVNETTIVNRCRSEDTYENRLLAGTLPSPDWSVCPKTARLIDVVLAVFWGSSGGSSCAGQFRHFSFACLFFLPQVVAAARTNLLRRLHHRQSR
jgi:hypothetical protein